MARNLKQRKKLSMNTLGQSVRQTRLGSGLTSTGTRQLHKHPANVRMKPQFLSVCSGKFCVSPPIPPDETNLVLKSTYNESDPAAIGETISLLIQSRKILGADVSYECMAPVIEGQQHYNAREDNLTSAIYSVTCLADNTWENPEWPRCSSSESCCIFYFPA